MKLTDKDVLQFIAEVYKEFEVGKSYTERQIGQKMNAVCARVPNGFEIAQFLDETVLQGEKE